MKVTEKFLKYKKSKNIRSFMVVESEDGQQEIRLSIEKEEDKFYIDTPTEISTENYSQHGTGGKKDIKRIFFHEFVYHFQINPIGTFLNMINKNSDVKFKVIAFNNTETLTKHNLTSHQLYGIIDGKKSFLLSSFTGEQNTASPIQQR